MHPHRLLRRLVLGAAALVFTGFTVHAATYGNIARTPGAGKVEFGLSHSQMKRDVELKAKATTSEGTLTGSDTVNSEIVQQSLTVRYGVSDTMAIGALYGNHSLEDESSNKLTGSEYGGMLNVVLKQDPDAFNSGFMIGIRQSNLSDSFESGPFQQLDLGFGFSRKLSDQANFYGNLIYSRYTGELTGNKKDRDEVADELSDILGTPVTVSSLKGDIEGSSPLLFAVGAEILLSSGSISLEYHAGAETGLALGFALAL